MFFVYYSLQEYISGPSILAYATVQSKGGEEKKKNLLLIYHTEVASLQNNLHMIAGKLHLATKRTGISD